VQVPLQQAFPLLQLAPVFFLQFPEAAQQTSSAMQHIPLKLQHVLPEPAAPQVVPVGALTQFPMAGSQTLHSLHVLRVPPAQTPF
jgi:hypothetical protein